MLDTTKVWTALCKPYKSERIWKNAHERHATEVTFQLYLGLFTYCNNNFLILLLLTDLILRENVKIKK